MNSIEALFALLAVASFAAAAVQAEKNALQGWDAAERGLSGRQSAAECAALANQYYATAGATRGSHMDCGIQGAQAVSGGGKSPAMPGAVSAGTLLVEVERHYG